MVSELPLTRKKVHFDASAATKGIYSCWGDFPPVLWGCRDLYSLGFWATTNTYWILGTNAILAG